MSVTHKLLKDMMASLRENKEMMRDKWLMLAAWKTVIYSHYDFGSGLEFSLQQLKKGLTLLGPISEKVSAGNDTGIHSRYNKWIGKDKDTFIYMSTSNKTNPSEPTMKKDWEPHMRASKEIVKKNSVIFSDVA
jgi:hypothetical protein